MGRGRIFRTIGLIVLTILAVLGVSTLVVRDQITRHRRDLFSRSARQRLAALGYISGSRASVDLVRLLRDFVASEPHSLLRRRAEQIIDRMEGQLEGGTPATAEIAG
jgi:hypothetical protein